MYIIQRNFLVEPNHDFICFILSAMTFGRKWDASPLFLMMSLTMVDATDVYFGSPVRKKVSISGSRVRLASAMVFSYSKSLTYLMPRKINFAPICLQKSTVNPSYNDGSTFGWSL